MIKRCVALRQVDEPQTTIAEIRSLKGKAAFIDGEGTVLFRPADPGTGIVFHVSGLRDPVPATYDRLIPIDKEHGQHTTTLRASDSVAIKTPEHLLAAVHGLCISNLIVVTNAEALIPFLDGSALPFADILARAEIVAQPGTSQQRIIVERPFDIKLGESSIYVRPDPGLVVSAAIDFPHPIGVQQLRYWHTPTMFCLHLAWARTFAFGPFKDEETTRKKLPGFEIHQMERITDSNMIVYRDGRLTTSRGNDEEIRHKILDLLGDLALLRMPLQGSLNVFRPSHSLNHELVRFISKELDVSG
ncbi:MAG: UDP-3-O-acyl-N-acetylglucosamine deacetylase [Candidatus Aminicenantes bacterium]|nr:UDP-3-O-acyl-N-acetylglucosamine deacetylase [Candidatus Aminicenantes bacterium]